MLYSFKGVDKTGGTRSGSIDASGPREARSKLRSEGLFVTDIVQEKVREKRDIFRKFFKKRVPQKEMTSFLRQMASLLESGITLMEILEASQKQSESPVLKKVINELKETVRQGGPLADGMEKAEGAFDPFVIAMVRAGEAGGRLGEVVGQIADYKESSYRRESAIKSAMVYPVAVASISLAVVIFLLTYIVPKVTVIFEDMGQALPLSTRILVWVADMLMNHGFALGIAFIVFLLAGSKLMKTKKGSILMDKIAINAWFIGPLVRTSILARWSHTTSVLLQAGLHLLETLRLSKGVTQNHIYANAIDRAIGDIREGGPIAGSLEKSNLFPPIALQMIAAGEKSGQSAKMLMRVANDQSAELEDRISALMSLVQPLLIVAVGLVVGFIVMAILLPIFEISQHI